MNLKEQIVTLASVQYGVAVKYASEMEVESDSQHAVDGKISLWNDGTQFTQLYRYTLQILTPKTRQSSYRQLLRLV